MEWNSTKWMVFSQLIIFTSNLLLWRLEEYSWTHVKEIANTQFLISLHHGFSKSANLEVFDVSRKGQAKKIYSFEEMSGGRNQV